MKLLFDQFSSRTSKMITDAYSTSFSLGILYINKRIRGDIYAIYGLYVSRMKLLTVLTDMIKRPCSKNLNPKREKPLTDGFPLILF